MLLCSPLQAASDAARANIGSERMRNEIMCVSFSMRSVARSMLGGIASALPAMDPPNLRRFFGSASYGVRNPHSLACGFRSMEKR